MVLGVCEAYAQMIIFEVMTDIVTHTHTVKFHFRTSGRMGRVKRISITYLGK